MVSFAFDECGVYKAITDVGKPVFHVEYDQKYVDDAAERAANVCTVRRAEHAFIGYAKGAGWLF